MAFYTIYCHIHIESGRKYIGLTSQTIEKRWKNHIYAAKSSKGGRWYFPNAIRKYGKDAFSHEILEKCSTLEVANLAEECWIEFYETRNPGKGFNIAKGGGSFVSHSGKKNPWNDPIFRKKMEESVLPKFIAAGVSPETRAKSKAIMATPEGRKALSDGVSRYYSDLSARAAQSEVVRSLHVRPGYTEKSMVGLKRADATKASKTHCKRGHEFTLENTYIDSGNWRQCRKCRSDRVSQKEYDARTHCAKDIT